MSVASSTTRDVVETLIMIPAREECKQGKTRDRDASWNGIHKRAEVGSSCRLSKMLLNILNSLHSVQRSIIKVHMFT